MAQVEVASASILDPQVNEVPVEQVKEDEGYVDLLVRVSLILVSKDFPLEVQRHGIKMLQHLLKFRHEELSNTDLLNLRAELVGSPEGDHISSKSKNAKEQSKHNRTLLVLAASNNLRIFSAEETGDVQNENEGPLMPFLSLGQRPFARGLDRIDFYMALEPRVLSCTMTTSCLEDLVNVPRKRLEPDGSSHSSSSNKSGSTSSETSYSSNSESNGSNNSSDEQVYYDASEYEVQRLMAIDISDNNDFADIVHPQMLRFYGKEHGHHVKGCLLLTEHNILCEGFAVIVCLRNPTHGTVVHCILNLLNMIWNKSDWHNIFLCNGFGLSCLFCDNDFLKMVCNMVTLCEDELKTSIEGRSDHTYFVSLLCMILPLLLQILRCIHSLWEPQIACNLFEELEKAKSSMNEGLKTTELLEEIRDCGYNVLGLCMSLEGAFAELLDFRHCPKEGWKEWMLELLIPVLRHCQELLYSAWFSLLYEGRAKVPYYFGEISEESEHSILLEFTRAVCQLLSNMTSLDSRSQKIIDHQDLEFMSSNSLVGYLLVHDCFWSLNVSLFGYWVDVEAARDGIHFCSALLRLAGVTKDERLHLFIIDELLPSLIKCIDDELPCAFRKLTCAWKTSCVSDDVEKDLVMLCRELYNYLSSGLDAQIQDIMEEGKDIDSAADNFTCWLAKQKKDLGIKAHCPAKEFVDAKAKWNWEFEDEFGRYLPLYIGMLKEVDAIDGNSKVDYSDWEILEKLTPEFRSKYAINSVQHPHFMSISCMRRRKFHSVTQVRNQIKIFAILRQLITFKPHIKGSDRFYSVIDRLEQNPDIRSMFGYDVKEAVEVLLDTLLYIWEPQYHPIIRKEHEDLLVWIIEQLTKGKEFEEFQPLAPDPEDFPSHLKPYAISYIMTTLKNPVYATAEEQLLTHIDFDNHLASGVLDNYIFESLSSRDDLSEIDVSSCAVPQKCLTLDHELIKLSLQRRAKIVKFSNQARMYSECVRSLLADDSLKGRLTNLMGELEVEGFFNVDSAHDNWEKKRFIELVDRFKDEVFDGCSLPRHYVIRGIIDCRTILTQKDIWRAFKQVVGDAHDRLSAYLPQFWMETRHYRHYIYDIVRQPLEKVFV
ncbi:hypothetical protein QOZ80_9AG0687520 [Eleusine coracana subsp. coracana]|nr:hypothetical protein QOZ80_9AG0687520 [Eleusine coracana subsp. coracana]